MEVQELGTHDRKISEQVLGYLNFSSGAADPRFLSSLNRVFATVGERGGSQPVWRAVAGELSLRLEDLAGSSPAFRDVGQARSILGLVWDHILPGYLEFHKDLLFHQTAEALFNAFFVGRVCEAVLQQGGPWDEADRIRMGAIRRLNDFIGYRPVAVLESQKIEPYPQEWVRPVPLYVRDAGVAVGLHREVVEITLGLLREAPADILREACFDLDQLDELAVDPRAYDFDHPVNKRPNYHFGQWDPHQIDQRGLYRRYVVQEVTLNALMSRLETADDVPREERVFEAAAVLAGTIIMSTGISGAGPDTHDSSITLATLLPRIAGYRDRFYEHLLERLGGRHGRRLREEAVKKRQPFGGARQHLNAQLARRRAAQLEHVHLAAIFARMGFSQAAAAHADVVPAASARMLCQIDCRLTEGDLAVRSGRLSRAAEVLDEIMDWLRRAIACGAVVDPWNILGFDGNFSLFPALENSVRDHRVDELVVLMEQVFTLYARVWSEAAARDNLELCRQVAERFRDTATWWRQYAAHEVSSVEAIDVDEAYQSAQRVAHALNLWHKGGAAAEDVRFWAPHADVFDSPKAFGLVITALLERGDFVASRALLVHWLNQAARIGLEKSDCSFFDLAERWMLDLRDRQRRDPAGKLGAEAWNLAGKFLDYLEANADQYWEVPRFELVSARPQGQESALDSDDEDEDAEGIYGAAYEDVVYRDSTDDGVDGEIIDQGPPSDDELLNESKRLTERLAFLSMIARLWQLAATLPAPGDERAQAARQAVVRQWIHQAARHRQGLRLLLEECTAYRLPTPSGDHDSMLEYDRIRLIKEGILENAVATCVDVADACRILAAVVGHGLEEGPLQDPDGRWGEDEGRWLPVLSGIFQGRPQAVRHGWRELLSRLSSLPLLYVPLNKGGDPREIVTAKCRQRLIQDLLAWLPRLGLVYETCQLIETAREMERTHPVGPGAVTEFDELFKIGYKSLVRTVILSATGPHGLDQGPFPRDQEITLVDGLKQLTEALLTSWLAHSKTLRLSVLERVKGKRDWNQVVAFCERYGADIFSQRFLNLGNLRAILHHGVEAWLLSLQEDPPDAADWQLLDDLESGKMALPTAADQLGLILEAVAENYGEYRDYNSMTTQSDRGELLYTLLDFLRLRTQYDRICWQLKPVIWAHELLVRHHHIQAAQIWRREFADQTRPQADLFLERLAELQQQYAMRMPTVADRLGERFVRPMVIDRIRALVRPAIEERQQSGPGRSFELLQEETDALTREPTGVGLDVPAWLMALEEEVALVLGDHPEREPTRELEDAIPQQPLTLADARRQLERWSTEMERK